MRDLHFVEKDVRLIVTQPERLRVGDEMHFVSALRQFHSEFGGNNTATAVSWIAGDPNLHEASFDLFEYSIPKCIERCTKRVAAHFRARTERMSPGEDQYLKGRVIGTGY